MGGDVMQDFTHVSFFELDRLFSKSASALRRRQKRQAHRDNDKAGDAGDTKDRSRTPPRRMLGRTGRVTTGFGGFTSKVEKVESTAIVTGVPLTADEKTLFKHFSSCGAVLDVMIVYSRFDRPTGQVIVEFMDEEAVARACAMPPPMNEILGKVVTVAKASDQLKKSAPAPKRMMTRQEFTQQVLAGLKTGGATAQDTGPNMRKLHIKNLRPVVTEEDMQGIFKPFGDFEEFKMGSQECWITYKNHSDAQDAMSSMQGFQLVGQELNITVLTVVAAQPAVAAPKFTKDPTMNLAVDSDFGATGAGANLSNRLEVMKKLIASHSQQGVPTVVGLAVPSAGASAPVPVAAPPPDAAANVPPTPKPGGAAAKTLLLQNMFTPSAVNLKKDPKFYEEIREDTHDECAKFGKVSHLTVDPRGSTGLIYVLYENPQQRQAAELALNGRWFEGKKINAQGIDDSIWQDLAAQAGPAAAAAAAAS